MEGHYWTVTFLKVKSEEEQLNFVCVQGFLILTAYSQVSMQSNTSRQNIYGFERLQGYPQKIRLNKTTQNSKYEDHKVK